VGDLKHDPDNVRRHAERDVESIKRSLDRYGQQKPVVADAEGVVRAGNGVLAAARLLGWEEVDVVRTTLTGDQLAAYAVADNRTSELSEWDAVLLTRELSRLREAGVDLEDVGFSEKELAALVAAESPPDEFPPVDPDAPCEYKCPKCGYEWSGASKADGDFE